MHEQERGPFDSSEAGLASVLYIDPPALSSYLDGLDQAGAAKLQKLASGIYELCWNEVCTMHRLNEALNLLCLQLSMCL